MSGASSQTPDPAPKVVLLVCQRVKVKETGPRPVFLFPGVEEDRVVGGLTIFLKDELNILVLESGPGR